MKKRQESKKTRIYAQRDMMFIIDGLVWEGEDVWVSLGEGDDAGEKEAEENEGEDAGEAEKEAAEEGDAEEKASAISVNWSRREEEVAAVTGETGRARGGRGVTAGCC